MPRPPQPPGTQRSAVARARVLPAALARIHARATRLDVDRSVLLRRMLTFAGRHMPDDFTDEDA